MNIRIFLIISLISILNMSLASSQNKFLPIEITDNKNISIFIRYDDTNRIKEVRDNNKFLIEKKETNTIYTYIFYPNGMLKEITTETSIVDHDTINMQISETVDYEYVKSDSVITVITYKQKNMNDVNINDTICDSKIFLNKEGLPYKKIYYGGFNNFMSTIDSLVYDQNNQIVKRINTMGNKYGDLNVFGIKEVLETKRQRNVFRDVTKSNLLQIPLETNIFYFFSDEVPILIKDIYRIEEETNENNIKVEYKLNEKGYPIEINFIKTKDAQQTIENIFVKYKEVKN